MHKLKRFLKWAFGILLGLAFGIWVAFQVSPWPSAMVIRQLFNQPIEIGNPSRFETAQASVSLEQDIEYTSDYLNNTLDIYFPANLDSARPVLIWLHGGGYVAGDKTGLQEFAHYVVDALDLAVISINYETAPSSQYPGQLNQLDEAIQFLTANQDTYRMLDLSQLVIGGDSAGAQIAGQYVAVQTNDAYAESLQMPQSLEIAQLKGFISFCGPLNLIETASETTTDGFMKFFVKTVAWSLIGERDWKNSPVLDEASLVAQLTEDFPPTYLTDGNAYSFEAQGVSFANRLNQLDVPVSSLFYTDSDKEIVHEYQFDFTTLEAEDNLENTLDFLSTYL